MIAITIDYQTLQKIGAQNVYVAISGCRSLLQSPGASFFENPRYAVVIVILSVIVPLSVIVGHCRSHLATLFGLAMVENPGLAVGISTLSVQVV